MALGSILKESNASLRESHPKKMLFIDHTVGFTMLEI